MSDPMGELDPDILARARAKASERGEKIEDVIERRMREYIADETKAKPSKVRNEPV